MGYSLIRGARIEDASTIVEMIRVGSDEGVFHSRCDSLEEDPNHKQFKLLPPFLVGWIKLCSTY